MTSFHGNSGQRCLSKVNLVPVDEGLTEQEYNAFYERVVDNLVKQASQMRVGYQLDKMVQMGPLRDKSKKQRVVGYIENGVEEADLLLNGRKLKLVGDRLYEAFLNLTAFAM